MEQEEYIVDGHKVTHSVHLGDREIFLAVQRMRRFRSMWGTWK